MLHVPRARASARGLTPAPGAALGRGQVALWPRDSCGRASLTRMPPAGGPLQGTWIDKARNAVTIKFESGQTKVVKQPRIIQENVTYAGKGVGKGPRETDGLGPSWKELYVGQRVTLSHEAIRRRELYRIKDSAGIAERREMGDTVYKAAMMCTGVILDSIEDNQLQTDVTYAPVCCVPQLRHACLYALQTVCPSWHSRSEKVGRILQKRLLEDSTSPPGRRVVLWPAARLHSNLGVLSLKCPSPATAGQKNNEFRLLSGRRQLGQMGCYKGAIPSRRGPAWACGCSCMILLACHDLASSCRK